MKTFLQDVRYGLRVSAKSPGFTLVAVLTLGLGIGANTAIFSFVNALLLRPPAVTEPDRLVRLFAENGGDRLFGVFSYPNFADLREAGGHVVELAAHNYTAVSLNAGAGARGAESELVSGNYFDVLGVRAARGRALTPADDVTAGAHPVVVISHDLWQRDFGGDPAVLERNLKVNGHTFQIVGVMPEGFRGSYDAFVVDLWAPMSMHEQVRPRGLPLTQRGWGWLRATGRLRPGVTVEQAQGEIRRLAKHLEQAYPDSNRGTSFRLHRAGALPEETQQGATGLLGFFMAVVGLVLLAACANIASVMLSRVAARRREIAIRQSLGATAGRLLRQWLTESVLLALAGGAAGLLVAVWVSDALLTLVPPDFENLAQPLRLDAAVLGFTFLVSVLTGLLCGIFPALRARQTDIVSVLKDETATAAGGTHRSRLQQLFIVTQIAVSLVILVTAGLLLRSLRATETFDPGFQTDRMLLARLDLRRHGYKDERARQFYRQLTERLRAQPGVRSVTHATVVPLGPNEESRGWRIEGREPSPGRKIFSIDTNAVGPGYFAAMGIPLVRGRDIEPRDTGEGARPVVVINETMARQFWPGQDPLGRQIILAGDEVAAEIVGVARDVKYYTLAEEPMPYVYGAAAQLHSPSMVVHVRTEGAPESLSRALRAEVAAMDANVAVTGLTTFAELRRIPLFVPRAMASVSTIFGLLALLLTSVGIYGLMSYSVAQRTKEIGVRIALGARRTDILRLVIGHGLALAGLGLALGLAASVAVTRYLSGLLFGVSATDPLTLAGISLLLVAVSLLACYLPARRATKVDPMEALRYE